MMYYDLADMIGEDESDDAEFIYFNSSDIIWDIFP
jgi:hypothetical protein